MTGGSYLIFVVVLHGLELVLVPLPLLLALVLGIRTHLPQSLLLQLQPVLKQLLNDLEKDTRKLKACPDHLLTQLRCCYTVSV